MLKISKYQKYLSNGRFFENSIVNIINTNEIYKSESSYIFENNKHKKYFINFLMSNGETIYWTFNEKKLRDEEYYNLVGK